MNQSMPVRENIEGYAALVGLNMQQIANHQQTIKVLQEMNDAILGQMRPIILETLQGRTKMRGVWIKRNPDEVVTLEYTMVWIENGHLVVRNANQPAAICPVFIDGFWNEAYVIRHSGGLRHFPGLTFVTTLQEIFPYELPADDSTKA